MLENWNGLRVLGESGVDFIVATNQPGVATKEVSETFLLELHQRMVSEMLNYGINVLAIYVCKHHWDEKCECRKPEPGMLLSAISDFAIDKNQTLYIGDDDRDLLAAKASNIDCVLIGFDHSGQTKYPNIESALKTILGGKEVVE
jgi:D-glycero-D-manno-heptose 1,7-bisphosphate phosphatase